MRTIEIEPYCDGWPKLYETEARKIQLFLGTNCLSTYHIGSTAIEGMSAKPIIDILVEARNIEDIDLAYENFEELGYIFKGEYGIEGRRFFYKGEEIRTHHIHFFEASNPELQRHKDFVEFLNCHPEWAKQYEALKIKLAEKYKLLPNEYSAGKREFLDKVDIEAAKWKSS